MREIEVKAWCDVCHEAGEKTPGETTDEIKLGRSYGKTVELCEAHAKELLEPLREVLAAHGVVPDGDAAPPKRKPRPSDEPSRDRPCLWCDEEYSSSTSWRYHVQNVHKVSSMTVSELLDHQCPLCGFKGKPSATGVGLANHIVNQHNNMNVQEALLEAHRLGDPHGVYARVFEQGA